MSGTHFDCPDESTCTAVEDSALLAAGFLNYCDGEALNAVGPLDAEALAQAKGKQEAGEDLSVEEQALLRDPFLWTLLRTSQTGCSVWHHEAQFGNSVNPSKS